LTPGEPQSQKWAARAGLVALVLLALAGLHWARPAQRLSSDVLDLVPTDERQPELTLIRSLAGDQQARVALFALDFSSVAAERREAAAGNFVRTLRASPAFAEVTALQDTATRDALGTGIFRLRLDLLFPSWLAAHRQVYQREGASAPWPEWLAARTVRELRDSLNQPEALAFQDLLPADPLLLIPGLVQSFHGLDAGGSAPEGTVLVWALLSRPPLQADSHPAVFAAVDEAWRAARAAAPGTGLRWTSMARFAAASRLRIEAELSTLNLLSLAAVLGVAAVCLRRLWKTIHLLPVILGSLLCAWTLTLLVFPHVHVLVFVIGSLLTGVAIDYGFYLYLQPPAYPGEPYARKAGRLLRPLLASALTAILGFSLLLFSELPLIRQLGLFVSAGLLGALTFALLWFAQLDVTYMETRPFARSRPRETAAGRRLARGLLLLGSAVALVGPWRLHWHDDIRELEIPTPALQEEAGAVRALFGDREEHTVYLTHGPSVAAARESLERFTAWHLQAYPNDRLSSAGQLLPTPSAWQRLPDARAELRGFPAALRSELARENFDPEAFAPFFSEWDRWLDAPLPGYPALAGELGGLLHGPLALLFTTSANGCWFISFADHPASREPPPDSGTVSVSQLEGFNHLFARYRVSALRLSALGLALVGLSVFALYGLRSGIRIFAIPVGACLFSFGVLGLFGLTLNLFHLLGAFLGVCLSHNYAIFGAENAARGEEPPPSIRLSAFCTAASFGALALSHIPVVAALGVTVTLIVLSALAIVELQGLAGIRPRPVSSPSP